MELWDAYLPNGQKAGLTLRRGAPIPDGLYHQVVAVLVKHADGTYLLMQRDFRKEYYPGQWEPGASGSALQGETPYAAALRELWEETGIRAGRLTFLFAHNNGRQAFMSCYLCMTDCPKQSVTLQAGETIAWRWVTEAEFMKWITAPQPPAAEPWAWLPYLDRITAFQGP